MSRTIDADAFADFIKNAIKVQKYDVLKVNDTTLTVADVLECVVAELEGTGIDGFKNNPTIEPEQRWIPVEEALPEPDVDVLLQLSDMMATGYYFYDGWHVNFSPYRKDVIAWRELPQSHERRQ